MKALHILKIVLKDTVMSREKEYIEEAIKELEELQNRSCENCKYLDIDLICTNEDTPCYSEYSGRSDNFNCNKWESIDEK